MKKILIINGSVRKKSTYSILKKIEFLLGEYDIEFININNYSIKPCIGCENCLKNGSCNINDDTKILLTKMTKSDAIIIGTPVYLRTISGYLKTLIDRSCAWYHRPSLAGKPIFFVTSTQVSGSKQSIRYLKDISTQWGALFSGSISRTRFNLNNQIKQKELAKFIYYLNEKNRQRYNPSIKKLLEFQTQKVLATIVLPLDFKYWTEKGYIDKHYFFDCRINFLKRIIGDLYYKMLRYFISKNKDE